MAEGDSKSKVVFIGWSGEKAKAAAEALRDFLRKVIQTSDPWVSSQDIPSGSVWDSELHKVLESAAFGISCVTADNVTKPWVNYEAGAMAQKLRGCYCPYLIDAPKNMLAPTPLTRLQAREANKEETKQLVRDICNVLAAEFTRIEPTFDLHWPDFETALNGIRDAAPQHPAKRDQRELLEEILTLVQGTNTTVATLARGRRLPNHVSGIFGSDTPVPTGIPLNALRDLTLGDLFREKVREYPALIVRPGSANSQTEDRDPDPDEPTGKSSG